MQRLWRPRPPLKSHSRNFSVIKPTDPKPQTPTPFQAVSAAGPCAHPRTGETVRFHLLHDLIQRAVREAACKVGLEGLVTPHVLRHACATHSREPIDVLRQLMGHVSIETTAGYLHPVVAKATNPLDDLLTSPRDQ